MVTQMVKSIRNVVIKLLSGLSLFLRKQAKTKDVPIYCQIRCHLSVGVANIYLLQYIMFSLPTVLKQ